MMTCLASLLARTGVHPFGLRRRLKPRRHQQNCGQRDDAADDHRKQSRCRHCRAGLTGSVGHQYDQHGSSSDELRLTWEWSTRHPFRYLMPHSRRTQVLLCFQVTSGRRSWKVASLWRLMPGWPGCWWSSSVRSLHRHRNRGHRQGTRPGRGELSADVFSSLSLATRGLMNRERPCNCEDCTASSVRQLPNTTVVSFPSNRLRSRHVHSG
jgi:hypothetical protein